MLDVFVRDRGAFASSGRAKRGGVRGERRGGGCSTVCLRWFMDMIWPRQTPALSCFSAAPTARTTHTQRFGGVVKREGKGTCTRGQTQEWRARVVCGMRTGVWPHAPRPSVSRPLSSVRGGGVAGARSATRRQAGKQSGGERRLHESLSHTDARHPLSPNGPGGGACGRARRRYSQKAGLSVLGKRDERRAVTPPLLPRNANLCRRTWNTSL